MKLSKTIESLFDFSNISDRKFCLTLGHLGMLAFVFFSIYFYQERLMLIDSSYYTYNLLHDQEFFIAHFRYINYFNQWLPLLMIKAGVGLKGVLISYSLSFMLFYYAIFAIVGYLFKNHKAALFMVITLLLSSRFKHFMAVTETTNTLAMSFLFIGWVTRERYLSHMNEVKEWGMAFLIILTLQIGHPIIFLPLLSFMAFYLVFNDKLKNSYGWLTFAIVIIGMVIRYKVMPSSGYEQNKMAAFQKSPEILANFFDQWTYKHLKDYTIQHYKWGYYLYLLGLFVLLYMRRFWSALVSMGTLCCFVIVVVIIYHKGESVNMLESYYTYFGYFWGFTLLAVFSELKASKVIRWTPAVLILVISFRSLFLHGSFFTDRLEYLYSLTEEAASKGYSKTLYPSEKIVWEKVIVPWSVSMTTLMYSTLKNPEDSRTVYLYHQDELKNGKVTADKEGLFYGPSFNLGDFKEENIPIQFFKLKRGKYYLVK